MVLSYITVLEVVAKWVLTLFIIHLLGLSTHLAGFESSVTVTLLQYLRSQRQRNESSFRQSDSNSEGNPVDVSERGFGDQCAFIR